MTSSKRITKDYRELLKNPVTNCVAAPKNESDMHSWGCTIKGPENTPFEGGVFNLNVKFPSDYPFKAPEVNFLEKTFHPNINATGHICLDILKDQWGPHLSLTKVLEGIMTLLNDPNPDNPFNPEAAAMMKEDVEKFKVTAKEYTLKYASGK